MFALSIPSVTVMVTLVSPMLLACGVQLQSATVLVILVIVPCVAV